MKIKYIKGFYYNGLLYGWNKNKLYRLPCTRNGKNFALKELTLMEVGNHYGYSINNRKKTIQQWKDISVTINFIYNKF